ncbi:hypothetical protein ALC56_05271 [Trachymyrmex septentrionalis]|uniref:Uncharacterized protein n=1 Tax=Trachymyrmex septentrionalis TaxID=34720 RepID=A0A195FIX8_9HYME|nr:hypothetical protein ALC56_05271 [Trachymyrmex septentrionalis]
MNYEKNKSLTMENYCGRMGNPECSIAIDWFLCLHRKESHICMCYNFYLPNRISIAQFLHQVYLCRYREDSPFRRIVVILRGRRGRNQKQSCLLLVSLAEELPECTLDFVVDYTKNYYKPFLPARLIFVYSYMYNNIQLKDLFFSNALHVCVLQDEINM